MKKISIKQKGIGIVLVCVIAFFMIIYGRSYPAVSEMFFFDEVEQIHFFQTVPIDREPDLILETSEDIKACCQLIMGCDFYYRGGNKYFYPTKKTVVFVLEDGSRWCITYDGTDRIETEKGFFKVAGKDRKKLDRFWEMFAK